MSEVEGLAKFGLFLFLAFILPGMIYVGFIVLYFPQVLNYFGWDLGSWVGFLGLTVFFGLTLTSVCFALENFLYYAAEKLGKKLERPEIIKLGVFEAKNKSTFYLNQVVGQYICHFNISIGVLLLTLFFLYSCISVGGISFIDAWKLIFGITISTVNFYLSLGVFRRWSVEAMKRYEKEC